jgi:hypothetical protein
MVGSVVVEAELAAVGRRQEGTGLWFFLALVLQLLALGRSKEE